ncbi:DUF3999 domain-containing protein [Buttiauxella sp. A2-C1_F]|uniref:DUF3999 domain-containing protein n=1 Tax=Buttiauxella sp. A2-C1_F TaxID=2904526 RepID=UPI001E505C82|nr:DUF3999 domain-containing protein [Buttiauxella sp. A2-C1_F]MCE0844881.1 DUF3999 domain-containing protein [Buttiauxella sp. A2-C1_F]
MKWNKGFMLGAMLCAALPVLAVEEIAQTPQDYAYGSELYLAAPSPWYRVELPLNVYQQSVWPDLRDVRVFNHQGEAVPFSLEAQTSSAVVSEPVALRIFTLDSSADTRANQQAGVRSESVILRSKNGIEIRLEGENVKSMGQSYLLTLPEDQQQPLNISQLQLIWDKPAENWQGKVSLYYSYDLREWNQISDGAPLMDLSSGSDRLTLDKLDINVTMTPNKLRYLLLVFDAQPHSVQLTGVNAVREHESPTQERISLTATASKTSLIEAVWHWSHPQPLTSLEITLHEDGVLPIEMAWRRAESDEWHPLAKQVIYQLNGKASAPIIMPNEPVQAVKITTLNARLPESLPEITGKRESQILIFNAQGTAPFTLAWGNRTAKSAALDIGMLIPPELRKETGLETFASAQAQEQITLGGEARLNAVSPVERKSQWQTVLIWGVLILGVAVLLWMAMKLWREVRSEKKE